MTRRDFFSALSIRSRLMLMGFVFFIFAPASILVLSPLKYDRSLIFYLTYALMGGLTAVGYAYSFLHNFRALIVVIPSQVLWFLMPPWFAQDFRAGFTVSLEGAVLVAMIVTAYVLFVLFFQREGVRTIRMETELALARQIHANLIPPVEKTVGRLAMYGRSIAGAEMGGDLIDVVQHDGATDIIIADVSGHGVKAGVIMAVVKSAFRTRLRTGCELDVLFRDVNEIVGEMAGAGMFVTAAALRMTTRGEGDFCGAGHGPILHYQAQARKIAQIESQSPPLGVIDGEVFDRQKIFGSADDLFLLMTDGLTEVFSKDGAMLGQAPIEALFQQHADRPLPELYDRIMETVRQHGPQSDDQTLLLVRVLSDDKRSSTPSPCPLPTQKHIGTASPHPYPLPRGEREKDARVRNDD